MRPFEAPIQSAPRQSDPPFRAWIFACAAFSALSALLGGLALLYWRHGSSFIPLALLEPTSFPSFLVPGLLLTAVVGGTSAVCSICALRRSKRTIDAAWLAGGALTIWIVAEAALLGEFHFLQLIYGALGIALLILATLGAQSAGGIRQRWTITVTVSEGLGFLAPLAMALLVRRAELREELQVTCIALAGGLEGAALGAGQAAAWPLPIRKGRYVALSAAAAAFVWALALTGRWGLLKLGSSHPAVSILLGVAMVLVGLTAIGALQALELRRVAHGTRRWIAWTALAWVVALPLSFLPSPLVDERTPWWTHLPLWASAGFIMAYAMALVTACGVTQLTHNPRTLRPPTNLHPLPAAAPVPTPPPQSAA